MTPETPSPVHVHAPHFPRHHLEPVGVFWDIENCAVPPDKSAFALANKIRKMFFEGKREAEFLCVCDIGKERKEIMDDLNRAQVHVCLCTYMNFCVCEFCDHCISLKCVWSICNFAM